MSLPLGIVTPVLHMNPRFDPPEWEVTASFDDVVAVVQEAERLGYDWVACSEHIAIPSAASTVRGGRYFDPFSTLGFLAAKTSRVGLLTHMAVLPYHHPLELVKRLGTLDVLSGGRVIAGIGVGSLQPEFEVLGHQFDGRGERSDDAIRAIRAAWGHRVPEYHGTHYDFEGFIVEPSGLPRPLEVWVGGRTRRSLRRALELGDAWMPFGFKLDELAQLLTEEQATRRSGPSSDRTRRATQADPRPRTAHRPPRPTGPHGGVPGGLCRHRRHGVQRPLRPPLPSALLRADGRAQVRGGRLRFLRRPLGALSGRHGPEPAAANARVRTPSRRVGPAAPA